MATKLTLRLEENVIESAKDYAKKHKTSLSRLVSGFLNSLGLKKGAKNAISPLVREITGLLPASLDADNLAKEYKHHLKKKHA